MSKQGTRCQIFFLSLFSPTPAALTRHSGGPPCVSGSRLPRRGEVATDRPIFYFFTGSRVGDTKPRSGLCFGQVQRGPCDGSREEAVRGMGTLDLGLATCFLISDKKVLVWPERQPKGTCNPGRQPSQVLFAGHRGSRTLSLSPSQSGSPEAPTLRETPSCHVHWSRPRVGCSLSVSCRFPSRPGDGR